MKQHYLAVFILLFFCVCSLNIYAQPKSRNIFFNSTTNIVRLHFTGQTPAVSYTGLGSGDPLVGEGLSHIERNDTILFFVNANGVYDKNLVQMPGSAGIYANPSSTEIDVCPMPGNPNKYYVFYNQVNCSSLYYSIVDLSLRGGDGDVSALNVVIDNANHAEGMEIVREPCSNNLWLITYKCQVGFDVFHITSSGLSAATNYPYVPVSAFLYSGQGQLEYHQGKVAFGLAFYEMVYLSDFDAQTGVMSNGAELNMAVGFGGTYGVQFSPDGSKLFVSAWGVAGANNLFQVNISNRQIINAWTVPIQCPSSPFPGIGSITLAPNGKLYIPEQDGCSIVEVENPDSSTPIYTFIPLTSNLSLGASDLIQGDYFQVRQPIVTYANCHSDSVTLILPGNLTQTNWQTNQDMYTTIATSNSIRVKADTIVYYASGLDAQNCEQAYAFTIKPAIPTPVNLGPDLSKEVCTDDDFITLSVDPSLYTSFKWSTGGQESSKKIREPGTYMLTTINAYNCSSADTINIAYTYHSGVQVPNLFTPNGDHKNDQFSLPGSECAKEFFLEIYNGWGEKVFESTNPFMTWAADNISDGLYFYNLNITWRTNEKIASKGWVQVSR